MFETERTAECLCGTEVVVDGDEAIERFGQILCRECGDWPVVFEAHCTNQLCDWSIRDEGDEFDRGHIEQWVRNRANQHEREKRVFEDDPTHPTEVREVQKEVNG